MKLAANYKMQLDALCCYLLNVTLCYDILEDLLLLFTKVYLNCCTDISLVEVLYLVIY